MNEKYIDIHTHHAQNPEETFFLYNITPEEFFRFKLTTGDEQRYFSAGIHPWHIAEDVENQLILLNQIAENQHICAIGETGLDKLCSVDFALQKNVFARHITIACEHKKPLIIHCVKAWSETMQMLKEHSTGVPVLFHGFRGKPPLARMLLNAGFYLSFGRLFNTESLKITPLERIFLETDNQNISIKEHYKTVADIKGITVKELVEAIEKNRKLHDT